jgi:hypothetical protein
MVEYLTKKTIKVQYSQNKTHTKLQLRNKIHNPDNFESALLHLKQFVP